MACLGLVHFAVATLHWRYPRSVLAGLYTILLAAPVELLILALLYRRPGWPAALAWLVAGARLLRWGRWLGYAGKHAHTRLDPPGSPGTPAGIKPLVSPGPTFAPLSDLTATGVSRA